MFVGGRNQAHASTPQMEAEQKKLRKYRRKEFFERMLVHMLFLCAGFYLATIFQTYYPGWW